MSALLSLFESVDIHNTNQVMEVFDSFEFPTLESQIQLLEPLRIELGFSTETMAEVLSLSLPSWHRIRSGKIAIQDRTVRMLMLQLLINSQNPDLFRRLNNADNAASARFGRAENARNK